MSKFLESLHLFLFKPQRPRNPSPSCFIWSKKQANKQKKTISCPPRWCHHLRRRRFTAWRSIHARHVQRIKTWTENSLVLFSWVSLQICDQNVSVRLRRLRVRLSVISAGERREALETSRVPPEQEPERRCQQGEDYHRNRHRCRNNAAVRIWNRRFQLWDDFSK